MGEVWRYFRVDGEAPQYPDPSLFTMKIYHGGRFHSKKGLNRQYRGGDVLYVDGVDPDKVSFTGLVYWAYDIGYQHPPLQFWFRIPGSEDGSGFLSISNDKEALEMCKFVPLRTKELELFIVCESARRVFTEEDIGVFEEGLDHTRFMGWWIDDIEEGEVGPDDGDDSDEEDWNPEFVPEVVVDLDGPEVEGNEDGPSTEGHGDRPDMEGHGDGPSMEGHGDGSVLDGNGGHEADMDGQNETGLDGKEASRQGRKVDKGKRPVIVEEAAEPQNKKKRVKKAVEKRYSTRSGGESSRRPAQFDLSSDSSTDLDDPNFDGIVDSDYDLNEEDDDVDFQHNVDGDPNRVNEWDDMGFDGIISSDDGNESDGLRSLHGSSDDEGEDRGRFPVQCRRRYSEWREFKEKEDMKKPTFELGMEFANSKVFKQAIRKHSVLTKKELRFPTNTRHKVCAKCYTSPNCPWRIYASTTDLGNPTIYIRSINLKHSCCTIGKKVYHMHAPFIAAEYQDFFMSDPNWTREGIQNAINKDFGMEVDYQMCYRAKLKAKKMAQGSHEDQYHLLESYAHELKKRNPGTSVWIQTELDGEVTRFKRIYICIEALKKGWREGCRPYIGLDGCHLKSVHKGQLLSAVGIDGNNGIYPIAWAVVEAESRETWTWFLEFLKVDLEIHHSAHYTFMSDKQKGLEQAIKELFPDAAHRHCVRHLHNNFKTDGFQGLELKQKLWAIARSCTINTFQEAMEDMKKSTVQGWQWCLDRPAVHWSKSYFDPKFKCEILLNNHSESFNKSILQARKKSILACLEDIRTKTMVRLANRRQSGHRWRCQVGPRVEKTLKKNAELAQEYIAIQSSPLRFEIQGKGIACTSGVVSAHLVALDLKQCSCKRWDISGLPCAHAVAAILSLGRSPDEFVDDYFTKDTYIKAYSPIMFPIAGVTEWDKLHRPIAPPLYRRQPGRPKQSRNKEAGEVAPPPGTQKLPKVYYSQVTCGICKKKGHNRRTCKQRNQRAGNVEEATIVQEEAGNVQEEVANVQEEAAHLQQPTEVEQESQPACEATQQSQTCTAPTTSSIPQFIQRRYKVLAHRKPMP